MARRWMGRRMARPGFRRSRSWPRSRNRRTYAGYGYPYGYGYPFGYGGGYLCLSEIKLAHTDDEVRQEMA